MALRHRVPPCAGHLRQIADHERRRRKSRRYARSPGGHSRDALVAAVIGERLRETFARERNELPEALAALLRSLDTTRRDHATIT